MKTSTIYPGVAIYEGPLGEAPKMGAFYVPKAGDVLARVAKAAGTTYFKIDAHPWNLDHLIYVTKETGGAKCSPRATTLAQKKAGFISLCKVNGAYQTIWIPGASGEGPEEISASIQPPKPDEKPGISASWLKRSRELRSKVAKAVSAAEQKAALLNDGVAPTDASLPGYEEPVKAGMSTGMIVGLVSVAAATILLFVLPSKKVRR